MKIRKENGVKCLFRIILIIFPILSFSEVSLKTEDQILRRLQEINRGEMSEFIFEMGKLDREASEYLKARKEKCEGDLVVVEVSESGEKKFKKKRVSKKEKKFCLFMLVKFRMRFTEMAFVGRKKYLNYIHTSQSKQLLEFEKSRLKELEKLSAKYEN